MRAVLRRWFVTVGLLALCLPLYADFTISPNSPPGPLAAAEHWDSQYPTHVTITGTGNVVVPSVCTGPSCGTGMMTTYLSSTNTCGGAPVTSVSPGNPATWCMILDGYTVNGFAPGDYNYSITFGSNGGNVCSGNCTFSWTLRVYRRSTFNFTGATGLPYVGCSNSDPLIYWNQDACAFSPAIRPGASTVGPQSNGGTTFTDNNFLGVITGVGQNGGYATSPSLPYNAATDSIVQSINLGASLMYVGTDTGRCDILSTSTHQIAYNSNGLFPNCISHWDQQRPNMGYFFQNGFGAGTEKLYIVTLITPCPVTCVAGVNYTVASWIYPGGGPISDGGDGPITKDNWISFASNGLDVGATGDNRVCMLKVDTFETHCSAPQTGEDRYSRWTQVSYGVDAQSGERFVIDSLARFGQPMNANKKFVLPSGAGPADPLVDTGYMPMVPYAPYYGKWSGPHCGAADIDSGLCMGTGHISLMEISGLQFMLYTIQNSHPFVQTYVLAQLNKGDQMLVPHEAGGGAYYGFPMDTGGSIDTHETTAQFEPVAVFSLDSDPPVAAYSVTGVATGGTTTITTSPNYPGANGDVLLCADVAGVTGLTSPMLITVAGLSGSTFNASGLSTSGTYTANTGVCTKNVTPNYQANQGALFFLDFTNLISRNTVAVKTLASARSFQYNNQRHDGGNGYYDQPHPITDPHGRLVGFESNFGYPESYGVYVIPTGYVPRNSSVTQVMTMNGVQVQ